MALIIEQEPLYAVLTAGQDIIFSVSNTNIVQSHQRVKFIAEVSISDQAIVPTTTPIGTFKTTPNGVGIGMFDFSPILESFVSPDNLAATSSSYKSAVTATNTPLPIHLIDEFTRNKNLVRYFRIVFKTEYLDLITNTIVEDTSILSTINFTYCNGYLKYTDVLDTSNSDFGYNLSKYYLNHVAVIGDVTGKFLTNAPMVQNALATDYGTVAMFSFPNGASNDLNYIRLMYTEDDGTVTTEDVSNAYSNGGFTVWSSASENQITYFGCYPANIYGWSTTFKALVDAGTLVSYTVQAYGTGAVAVTEPLTINILCPTLKGYEPIRLTWLNQWGVWDYYTFNMKSTKMISTKGSTYDQLAGTWNEKHYRPNSYKGGKKSFRVNSTEKIKMNTDFVSEAESEWFEELINSPEVYILEGFQTDTNLSALNNYVTPVRLTTSSYTRKTIANDKLMQYTFEVEKSKTLRTQSV